MWRKAQNSLQKKAVIDGLLPITGDEYLKAMVHFAGDDDEDVWQRAIGKLKEYKNIEIKKHINSELPDNSILALLKLAGERKDASLFIFLLETGKLKHQWIFDYLAIEDEIFWKTLITHKDFIVFSTPKSDEFIAFFVQFSAVLADLYIEQSGYLSDAEKEKVSDEAKEAEKEAQKEAEVEQTQPADEKIEEDDDEPLVLGEDDFDFPDFLLSDSAFEGLKAEDISEKRQTTIQILNDLSMGQKIKAAMMGNLEVRKILIKDPKKQVALAVLNNQRITVKEVAGIASDAAAPLEVISYIAQVKSLSKSYQVKLSLVMNPKTPIKIAMNFLDVLRLKDIKMIAKSRKMSAIIKQKAMKKIK